MRGVARSLVLVACGLLWAAHAQAQTADEMIEKYLTAMGGRAALAKLTSQVATGTITVSAQGNDLSGPVEAYEKAPNKSRLYFKLDLSQMGAGELVIDQRCDGKIAYAMNSMQGDREITGNQLQGMLNERFPSPYLDYKQAGDKVELVGKDTIGTRAVFVLLYTPKLGPSSRQFIDAETFLALRSVIKIEMPDGSETEQTSDLEDYRSVDGVKMPFTIKVSSVAQAITISLAKIEHNVPLDDTMFSRPAVK